MKKIVFGLAMVASIVLFSCKSNSASSDPKAALKGFFEAMSKKDIAAAKKFATEESSSMFSLMEMGIKEAGGKEGDMTKDFDMSKVEFGEPIIEGDKAKVPVKNKAENETINFRLKKEKGAWKVAFDKSSMMEMASEKMSEKGVNLKDSIGAAMDKIGDMDSIGGEMDKAMKEAGVDMKQAAEEVKKSLKEIETEKK
jgi:Domain of unknown function (DUF4878)